MTFRIIAVDYQNDFCSPQGKYYQARPCHTFIETIFVPYLKQKNIKIAEIVCDYRLPRPGETEAWCIPGEWGYQSAIDADIKLKNSWVKGMHSPEWVRENGGNATKQPGPPYQDPQAFNQWLLETIGTPEQAGAVVLIGLTLEVCVLCTAQQLNFRGYDVRILKEGSDICDLADVEMFIKNNIDYKNILFNTSHREFAQPISWDEFKMIIENSYAHTL